MELIPAEISQENAKLISKWRKENWSWFLTKFNVTTKGTLLWLEKIWDDPERFLFIIILDGEKIGHVGIYNFDKKNLIIEIDSVLKGVKTVEKKIMKKALLILFEWIFNDLKLKEIQLEVFSDNYRAVNLYESVGMSVVFSTPLKKMKTSDGWIWKKTKIKKTEVGQRYLNIMKVCKPDFLNLRKIRM